MAKSTDESDAAHQTEERRGEPGRHRAPEIPLRWSGDRREGGQVLEFWHGGAWVTVPQAEAEAPPDPLPESPKADTTGSTGDHSNRPR